MHKPRKMTICEFGTKLGHRLTYTSHALDLGGVHHFLLYNNTMWLITKFTLKCLNFLRISMTPQIKTCSVLKLWNLLNPLKQVYFEHVHYLIVLIKIFSMLFEMLQLVWFDSCFLSFSGWESNCWFDFQPFFGHLVPNSQL